MDTSFRSNAQGQRTHSARTNKTWLTREEEADNTIKKGKAHKEKMSIQKLLEMEEKGKTVEEDNTLGSFISSYHWRNIPTRFLSWSGTQKKLKRWLR